MVFQHAGSIPESDFVDGGRVMKNWLIPLTVLGLSGLALFYASDRGRTQLKAVFNRVARDGDPLGDFNRFLDDQLDAIQRTLDDLSDALEEQRA